MHYRTLTDLNISEFCESVSESIFENKCSCREKGKLGKIALIPMSWFMLATVLCALVSTLANLANDFKNEPIITPA